MIRQMRADFILILLGMVSAFTLGWSVAFAPSKKESLKSEYFAPPPMIEYFSFGFQQVVADSMWIRAVQDFDFCEDQIKINLCKGKGWLYRMVDTVTNLAPDFKEAYAYGGLALTVIISDIAGASAFFDKGVRAFPNDWNLLYIASYHALFEENNKNKAANLILRSAQNGGPPWLYSLATRLYTEAGRKEIGVIIYENLKRQGFNEELLERMQKKLSEKIEQAPSH